MMKKMFLFLGLLAFFISLPAMAQAAGDDSTAVMGLTTFMGIVALVSFAVTQLSKYLVFVEKTVWKILTSVATGVLLTLIAWHFGLADYLTGLVWWQAVLQGIFAGLSACGLYDFLKALGLAGNK
jgi:hypothetical protein